MTPLRACLAAVGLALASLAAWAQSPDGAAPIPLALIEGLSGPFGNAGEAVHHVAVGHFDRDSLWRLDLLASSGNGRLVQMAGL